MLLAFTAVVFVALLALSMPIVFALGIAGIAGLALGGYPLQMLPSSLVSGSQNWVLLAIPSFVFAGTPMGMLVPPAIFMIVIGEVTNTSVVALFLAGFIPAAVVGLCLCALVFVQARLLGWPKDTRPSWAFLLRAARNALVPMVVPVVILGGFYLGMFTATEAGAVVAFYAFLAARFYYRNVSLKQMLWIAYESALLTAAVVFLLAVATIFQYLMGVSGVPVLLGYVLEPLGSAH